MRVKKAIKKVAALVAGASMVGATIVGASAAADLANYPSPFIKDGVFDAILVVGDDAKAEDVIGVTDIATSLQFAAKTVAGSGDGTTSTTVSGDKWLIGSRGDSLELTDSLGGEDFDSQITRVSESELQALADGSTSTQKGTAPYEQFIRLEDGSVVFEENTENDVVGDFVKYENTDFILNYSLEFTTSWESDIEDSTGTADTTGLFLTDYEDEEINFLGKKFTVLKARRYSSTLVDGIKLTFLGGDVTDTIEEGETKTYNVDGKEYEVENVIVTDSGTIYTQLRINGLLTKKLQEDQTETLDDGSILGVADILSNEAGDVTGDLVRFYLGAQKIQLEDSDITNSAVDNKKLSINDEDVGDATVVIKGTNNANNSMKIDQIKIDLQSDDQLWVGTGEKLSDNPEIDEDTASALKALGLDIFYGGLTEEASNEVLLDSVSDDRYELKFKNTGGNSINLPLAYDNDTASSGGHPFPIFGDKNDKLVIDPDGTQNISDDQYFILTDKTDSVSAFTEVVQYKGSGKLTDSNPEAKFKLLGAGETVTRTVTSVTAGAQITLNVGGDEYTFVNATDAGSNNFQLRLTDGPSGRSHTVVVTENGARITLRNNGTANEYVGGFIVDLVEVAKQMDNRTQPDVINYNITASTTEDKVGASRAAGVVVSTTDYDNDISEGMNAYGIHIKDSKDSTNPRELVLTVPANQRLPQAYLTSGITTTSTSTSSGGTVTEIVKIDVGAAQLASKVAGRETSENLILVGGPCANKAAATLMGVTAANCADGFVEGEAKVKLWEHDNGKVALLVAGYSAGDTRAAAQVVANFESHSAKFKGMELKVSDTSAARPTLAMVSEASAAADTSSDDSSDATA